MASGGQSWNSVDATETHLYTPGIKYQIQPHGHKAAKLHVRSYAAEEDPISVHHGDYCGTFSPSANPSSASVSTPIEIQS